MSTAPSIATSRPQSRRPISTRRKLLYLLLSLFLFLLLCEGAVRLHSWRRFGTTTATVNDSLTVYDPDLDLYVPRPGYKIRAQKTSITINSLGFRGPEITREKPPGTVRIACLGSSTTLCAQVPDQDTWPQQLQELLQVRCPQVTVQVINAGVGGYVVAHSLKRLKGQVLSLSPDLVILHEANNDMAADTTELARRRGLVKTTDNNRSAPVRFLSTYCLLFDLLYKNSRIAMSKMDTNGGKLNGLPEDLPKKFIDDVDAIHQVLAQKQIPMVLSTFLSKYRRNQERAVQIANADVAFFYMPWMTIDDLLNGLDSYNQALIDYGRTHNVPVIEDRESIPGDSKHFVDFAHMSKDGCALMANRVADFLEKQGLLQRIVDKCEQGKSLGTVPR